MKNLNRCVFSCDQTWTAPAGVYSVKAAAVPIDFNLFPVAYGGVSTPSMAGINTNCDAYMWGLSTCGMNGAGVITSTCQPTLVCCGIKWRSISVGELESNAVDVNGNGYAWGNNNVGQAGTGTSGNSYCLPTPICCGFKWKQVSTGIGLSNGITCGGDMYAWGAGACGALGINSITNATQPTLVCCGFKWKMAIAKNIVMGGITTAGDLYMWGKPICGMLGVGNFSAALCQPTKVCCGLKWKAFSIGELASAGISVAGDLYMWGQGVCGMRGDGTTNSVCQPTLVSCGFKWKMVAVGNHIAGAIDLCGNLWMWGDGSCGGLGNGGTTSTCTPSQVCCGLKWKSFTAFTNTAFGITTEGVMYGWGNAPCGLLGNNTITNVCKPTPVCCGFTWGLTCNQFSKIYPVIPGTTYNVAVFGQFPSFQYEPIMQDYAVDSIILEYYT